MVNLPTSPEELLESLKGYVDLDDVAIARLGGRTPESQPYIQHLQECCKRFGALEGDHVRVGSGPGSALVYSDGTIIWEHQFVQSPSATNTSGL